MSRGRARVLVSDAETPAALAVVRSLGRAGHRVAVVAHSRRAVAAASRRCEGVVRAPDPRREPEEWTEAILAALRGYGRDFFLPVTDTALVLADRARERFPPCCRPVLPPRETLATALDKVAVLDRAAALGIPVLPHRTGAETARTPMPAVLKPRRSRAVSFRCVHAATARIVGRPEDLPAAAAELDRRGLGHYAEPWVPGVGHGIFLLVHEGEVLARFAHRRIREASPLGGPSAAAESVPAHPALLAWAEALAQDLGIEGPFMAEFRGQGDDFVLLEVNVRWWGSLGLALLAGVDLPRLHLAALLGRPERGSDSWKTGVAARYLPFDLRRCGVALRGRPWGLSIPWPDRVGAVLDLLGRPWRGLVSDRDDPAPARAHVLDLLAKVAR